MTALSFDLTLPPPASSTERIRKMVERAVPPDIHQVVDLLERDPVTVAHLLRQVNSSTEPGGQRVASLERTATILGFEAVSNTVFVEGHAPKPEGLDTDAAHRAFAYIIRTSVAAGEIAKRLATQLRMAKKPAVITAALVHQLGRMVFLASEPATYAGLWAAAGSDLSIPPGIGEETAQYRTDYARHGAEVAQRWQLPDEIIESIRFHFDPERATNTDEYVVAAVAVSQLAARTLFESDADLDRDQALDRIGSAMRALASEFQMSRRELEDIVEEAKPAAWQKALDVRLFRAHD